MYCPLSISSIVYVCVCENDVAAVSDSVARTTIYAKLELFCSQKTRYLEAEAGEMSQESPPPNKSNI